MKFYVNVFIAITLPLSLFAQDGELISESLISTETSQFGVSASAAGGLTNFTIESSNGNAIYSGYGLDFRFNVPVWQNEFMAINTDLSLNYIDASNNSNSGVSKEFVKLLGPGLGLNVNIYRLLIGANYHLLKANHIWIGSTHDELSYDLKATTFYVGIHFSITETMQIIFSQNTTTSKVPSSQTNFTEDSPFKASTFWIHLTYSSGSTITGFFEKIFK